MGYWDTVRQRLSSMTGLPVLCRFVGVALLLGALLHAPTRAAPELSAAFDVFLSLAQRASDNDTWVCGSSGPSESPCFRDGAAQASVSFDQWGHQAGASATPGTLRAWAHAEWPDQTSTARFATAQAQIVDIITLRHPNLDPAWEDRIGTRLRVRYSVNGELNFSNAGTAAFTTIFSASAGSAWFEGARFVGRRDAQGTVSAGFGAFDEYQWPPAITGNPFGLFETYVRMPFNAPITLTWTLLADAGLLPQSYGTAGSAQARLDHTAVFLGIDIMESDGDGVLRRLDGATIHSASGYDWASPVPAPATAWLFAAGLLVLAGRLAARETAQARGRSFFEELRT